MLYGEKSRKEANTYLEQKFAQITKAHEIRTISKSVLEKFNIPIEVTTDVITFRKNISELTNFEIFAIVYVLNPNQVSKYFTQDEINYCLDPNNHKEKEKISLPIIFRNIIQISDNQWIGRTSVKQLMELRDSQMINYPENSQRIKRRVMSGGIETLRININKANVSQIKELFLHNLYIPDDITFNMPIDGSEFLYDEKKAELIITKLPNNQLDILDGYHRYLAISQICNFDNQFDYPMELRIVNFSLEIAQQFIYQKDQKTQMKKIESQSFNQYSVSNRIVDMINADPKCLIQGLINRTNGLIDMAQFSLLVKRFIVPNGLLKTEENQFIIKTKKTMIDRINSIVESNQNLLINKWNIKTLFCIVYIISKNNVDYVLAYKMLESNLSKNNTSDYISGDRVVLKRIREANKIMEGL